jgi:tetratricopeptide (TPR) repeat protein
MDERRIEALRLWQAGRALLHVHTRGNNNLARAMFSDALQLDPTLARAEGLRAYTHVRARMYGWDQEGVDDQAMALELANKAFDLDSVDGQANDYDIYWSRGVARLWNNLFQDAVDDYTKARARNPLDPDLLASMSDALVANGQAGEAVEQTQLAMALNPQHPSWYPWNKAFAFFALERYDEAIETLQPVVRELNAARLHLAASYALRNREPNPDVDDPGDAARAREEIAQLLAREPQWTVAIAMRQPLSDARVRERLESALKSAGLQ